MRKERALTRLAATVLTGIVLIGTAHAADAPYTVSADHWSREDFSQQANPAAFTEVYDRQLYNTFRQTIVDGTSEAPAHTMVGDSEYSAVKNLMARLDGTLRYEHYVPEDFANYYEYLDYFAVSAEMPEDYQAPREFVQPVMDEVSRLETDAEKVEYLNDYLCSLLTYKKGKTAAIAQIFSQHPAELQAACGTYARAFKFLCQAADIPCFTISAKNHGWNLVYADGKWLHVDVSTNDANHRSAVLLAETVSNRADLAPEATAFLKELLVPGSTK